MESIYLGIVIFLFLLAIFDLTAANLEKMLDIARTLSQGYTAVRVDLYSLNDGSIKFGEMTFTTESGISRWHPESANDFMGSLIHLPGVDDAPAEGNA